MAAMANFYGENFFFSIFVFLLIIFFFFFFLLFFFFSFFSSYGDDSRLGVIPKSNFRYFSLWMYHCLTQIQFLLWYTANTF